MKKRDPRIHVRIRRMIVFKNRHRMYRIRFKIPRTITWFANARSELERLAQFQMKYRYAG